MKNKDDLKEDETGQELFRQKTSIELSVHYLSSAKDTSIVDVAKSGENYNIRSDKTSPSWDTGSCDG